MTPPFFAQWESAALVADFLAGWDAATDPLWAESGAESAAEYATWASHLCGMACLKMALAARGEVHRIHELRRAVQARGGYVVDGEAIHGLIYAGAVAFLQERDIPARIVLDEPTEDIPAKLAGGRLFIASVHASIRRPDTEPPQRGGHLILVFGLDEAGRLRFHNPSGDTEETRRDVRMGISTFSRFHAERGILIG
ncbi:hypothetical protein [Sabulicella rubraurantiaca]|uniref:hypothetical protein n=1 Tax=Sabulicella rubraurantiaca TaxID=2811429 RepID=UPI001A95D528|nr:hypothetical protein [Sabulicella rubraurantiaca]